MNAISHAPPAISLGRKILNKVPEVTLFFWIIKIMATTVGETAADYLNFNLGFGLTNTTYVTGALLAVLLTAQFSLKRYVPGVYWSAVVVISVFGTLITDNTTDAYNIPLTTSTAAFTVILAAVFGIWYAVERTLSIDSIDHAPRGVLLAGDPVHLRAGRRRRHAGAGAKHGSPRTQRRRRPGRRSHSPSDAEIVTSGSVRPRRPPTPVASGRAW